MTCMKNGINIYLLDLIVSDKKHLPNNVRHDRVHLGWIVINRFYHHF